MIFGRGRLMTWQDVLADTRFIIAASKYSFVFEFSPLRVKGPSIWKTTKTHREEDHEGMVESGAAARDCGSIGSKRK
jgi:hypothetical protein